jgi:competence protein ComFC
MVAVAILSKAAGYARDWRDAVLNLAFPFPESDEAEPKAIVPPFCGQCGYPYEHVPDAPFVCSTYAATDWFFAWARAGYLTEGQVLESVVGFKYKEEFFRLNQLAGWLTEAFDRHAAAEEWDALVPVPLYHRRLRSRGFNQARELANVLGRRRGIPVWSCLRRLRETPSQTGLDRGERRENMRGAFAVKGGFDVTGRRLLLIDDVFTTGATTNACARVLAEAGAGQLAVLTVSRS